MTLMSDMVTRVRSALGVNATYEAVIIPAGISDTIRKLLRDYNFPKSVVREEFTPLTVGQQNVELPEGFKRPLLVQFHDTLEQSWTDPLHRRESFVRPATDLNSSETYPRNYWLEGTKLWWDTALDSGYATTTLQIFYQSSLVSAMQDWMLEDYGDVIFTYTVVRMAPEVRKSEVLQAFAPLWQLDQASIATYLNELEFAGLHMQWREPQDNRLVDRYGR